MYGLSGFFFSTRKNFQKNIIKILKRRLWSEYLEEGPPLVIKYYQSHYQVVHWWGLWVNWIVHLFDNEHNPPFFKLGSQLIISSFLWISYWFPCFLHLVCSKKSANYYNSETSKLEITNFQREIMHISFILVEIIRLRVLYCKDVTW